MKKTIRFKDWDDAVQLVSQLDDLKSDVNIYNGKLMFDAKSILGVTNLDFNKDYTIEFVGQDDKEENKFEKIVKDYEV